MRVLVTGRKAYRGEQTVRAVLHRLYHADPEMELLLPDTGASTRYARDWAKRYLCPWTQIGREENHDAGAYGQAQWWLAHKPDLVLLFGVGATGRNLRLLARAQGIPVTEPALSRIDVSDLVLRARYGIAA